MPTPPLDPDHVLVLLKQAFPDAVVTPALAREVTELSTSGHFLTSTEMAVRTRSAAPGPPRAPDPYRYYLAHAVHSRTFGTTSKFVGKLPLVRFQLPDTPDTTPIATSIGYLLPEDRKILCTRDVEALVGRLPRRVEMITPARAPGTSGARFAAIAVYLCYDVATGGLPSFYILEAGTATGQPRVLFLGDPADAWITNQQSSYQPTPFSKETNFYSGTLNLNGDEPFQLLIQSRVTPDADPYIVVTIEYQPQATPPENRPLFLILEAAARVGVIGHVLGIDPGVAQDLAALVLGHSLDWIVHP